MFLFDFYTIETFSSKISSINLSLFQKIFRNLGVTSQKFPLFPPVFSSQKKISSQAAWQDGVFLDVGTFL